MAPQGSTSECIFRYQNPALSVHMPKISNVQSKKGHGGNKDWAASVLSEVDFLVFLQGLQEEDFLCCFNRFFYHQSRPELVLR